MFKTQHSRVHTHRQLCQIAPNVSTVPNCHHCNPTCYVKCAKSNRVKCLNCAMSQLCQMSQKLKLCQVCRFHDGTGLPSPSIWYNQLTKLSLKKVSPKTPWKFQNAPAFKKFKVFGRPETFIKKRYR
mgnify:CR=1 FL=1